MGIPFSPGIKKHYKLMAALRCFMKWIYYTRLMVDIVFKFDLDDIM